MPVKNIVGEKFGMLTVVSQHDTHKGYARWNCLCDCGAHTIALGTHLRQGNTQSCGCLQKTTASSLKFKHGWHGTRTYEAWQNMIRRCVPGTQYHARGIEVCAHWKESFNAFLAEMGEQPAGYSLERKDPDGDYCQDNCEWLPKSENTIDTYRGKLTKRGREKKAKYG